MDYIYKKLPKDLAYLIDDYAKDRTQMNRVVKRYQELLDKSYIIGLIYVLSNNDDTFHLDCECKNSGINECRRTRYNYCIRSLKRYHSLSAELKFKMGVPI